jgi:hypothetical protein
MNMERNKLYEAIKEEIITTQEFNLANIVKDYSIGINKASMIADMLVEDGVISKYSKKEGRKVLMRYGH